MIAAGQAACRRVSETRSGVSAPCLGDMVKRGKATDLLFLGISPPVPLPPLGPFGLQRLFQNLFRGVEHNGHAVAAADLGTRVADLWPSGAFPPGSVMPRGAAPFRPWVAVCSRSPHVGAPQLRNG